MKTAEHIAWENLNKRIEEKQEYPGSELFIGKVIEMRDEAWKKAVHPGNETDFPF